jgi:hypothetical protein
MSVSRTTNTTLLPSGDSVGSETRLRRTRSSTEKGCRSASAAAATVPTDARVIHDASSERAKDMERNSFYFFSLKTAKALV